jgi:hypothetical protein
MLTFKVTAIGSSAGFILTKEAMARLKIKNHQLSWWYDGEPLKAV